MSKLPAKAEASGKAPAKAVVSAKTSAKTSAKKAGPTAGKPVAKPAPKPVAKPAPKPVAKGPAKPLTKPVPVAETPVPAPVPKPAAKPAPKASAKPAAAKATPAATATAPAPAPAVNRFNDRFAPAPAPAANRFTDRFAPAPRPAPRPMTETAELPKPAHKIDPKLANAWKTKPGRELTEAELLAMPDSEYMNDKQIEFFRTNLQTQKDDLLSNAGETTEHLREDTSIVPDPADRATIEEEHALELRTRDRERKLLKKIAQSLTRLDTGEYGFCDETGEPIGLARLLARPTATLSLEAQQRRELKQKMFGD